MADLSVLQFLRANRFDPALGIRRLLSGISSGSLRFLLLEPRIPSPDVLLPNQQLNTNDQLTTTNNLLNFIVQADGNLVLYRTQFGRALWSSNTTGKPISYAMMQADGDFVASSSRRIAYWNTGTSGHPGACLILSTDGNLEVYDANARAVIWKTNTTQDFSSPTFLYTDSDGYNYDETSESWKQMCEQLPCFDALQWPDYASTHIETTINGEPVVVQLWKGRCEKFLNLSSFPGGIGAEVGIYRRMPGRARPTSLPFLPPAVAAMILALLATVSDDNLWWPYPELAAQIDYSLINPVTKDIVFRAGPETTYWLAKWMNEDSFENYEDSHPHPLFAAYYTLDYRINGKGYPRW